MMGRRLTTTLFRLPRLTKGLAADQRSSCLAAALGGGALVATGATLLGIAACESADEVAHQRSLAAVFGGV